VSTACSSSAKVFGSAARMIAAGIADAAVVGGTDSLCLTTLYGFRSLELLSGAPCRPFDPERNGISIGEGAGFALLEREGEGAVLAGVGESCDAYHMSTPHPEGLGARLAMERALAGAGLRPEAIGYVNLHGTATRTNDVAEGRAVRDVFGPRTPASATKGAHGHLLGAAGITEAIVALLALERGWLPGTANTRILDVECAARVLLEGETARPRYVLSNSFGFGGNNCSVIFGRA
jgi:3-oxoacyl-[acyl-carrier-protein] synthase-1